jgi:hypothetical protein
LADRLAAFYAVHQPDKVGDTAKIEKTAKKYADDESPLNAALQKKYGVDLATFVAPP